MATMTMRLDDADAKLVRAFAESEGKTISDFMRDAVLGRIEDEEDIELLRQAIEEDDGVRYTQGQILRELGLA